MSGLVGNVTMRQALPSDAPAIRDLTLAAYAKWVPLIGREPMPMRADYEWAVRHHRFDLLFVGVVLAALIETIAKDDHLLIQNVAVLPDYQGRGFGQQLLRHAETLAASAGHDEIRLYTNQRFIANLRLYEKLGYVSSREEDVPDVGVRVHMSKRL